MLLEVFFEKTRDLYKWKTPDDALKLYEKRRDEFEDIIINQNRETYIAPIHFCESSYSLILQLRCHRKPDNSSARTGKLWGDLCEEHIAHLKKYGRPIRSMAPRIPFDSTDEEIERTLGTWRQRYYD